jgi:fructoselysine-6-P-deglycase FrlB-like protein
MQSQLNKSASSFTYDEKKMKEIEEQIEQEKTRIIFIAAGLSLSLYADANALVLFIAL